MTSFRKSDTGATWYSDVRGVWVHEPAAGHVLVAGKDEFGYWAASCFVRATGDQIGPLGMSSSLALAMAQAERNWKTA